MRRMILTALIALGAASAALGEEARPKQTVEELLAEFDDPPKQSEEEIIAEIMRSLETKPKRSTKTKGNCRFDVDCAETHECLGYSPGRERQLDSGEWYRVKSESFGVCSEREKLNNPSDEGESI